MAWMTVVWTAATGLTLLVASPAAAQGRDSAGVRQCGVRLQAHPRDRCRSAVGLEPRHSEHPGLRSVLAVGSAVPLLLVPGTVPQTGWSGTRAAASSLEHARGLQEPEGTGLLHELGVELEYGTRWTWDDTRDATIVGARGIIGPRLGPLRLAVGGYRVAHRPAGQAGSLVEVVALTGGVRFYPLLPGPLTSGVRLGLILGGEYGFNTALGGRFSAAGWDYNVAGGLVLNFDRSLATPERLNRVVNFGRGVSVQLVYHGVSFPGTSQARGASLRVGYHPYLNFVY